MQNNQNSPHDVRSPDCRVLTQTYSPNLFSSRFWQVGERWFLSLGIGQQLSACAWFKDKQSNKVTSVVETVVTKKNQNYVISVRTDENQYITHKLICM